MKNSGYAPILVMFSVFIALSLAAAAYIFGLNGLKSLSVKNKGSQGSLNISTPSPSPATSADWQAYDSPGSWSLKYPAEWSLVATSEGCGPVFAPTDNQGYWVTVCGPYVNADETPEFLANQANVSGKGQISGLTVGGHTAVRLDETLANSFSSSVFVEKVAESASASGTLGIYLYVTDKTKLEAAEAAFGQILPTFEFFDAESAQFTCPANGWANCMPILNDKGLKACSKEAIGWYTKNCPNFRGVAQ